MTNAQCLALVRGVHTLIYVVMAASAFIVLYAGVVGAQGPWLWAPLGLLGIEIVIFVGGRMKCPLSAVAVRYGAGAGPLFDTFLPERVTRHTLRVFGPLIALGLALLVARWAGALG